ncbi:MAG: protein adenylyltransferase SelO family protein, partial [Vulcanimicrobiaceae bacterium]
RELRAKLGLRTQEEDDALLFGDLLESMDLDDCDYTRTWRTLATVTQTEDTGFSGWFTDRERIAAWVERYRARLAREGSADAERRARMNQANPKYVLRNYLAQIAIQNAERKDFSEVRRLLAVLRRPFDEHPEHDAYAEPPPDWGRHLVVSCSS